MLYDKSAYKPSAFGQGALILRRTPSVRGKYLYPPTWRPPIHGEAARSLRTRWDLQRCLLLSLQDDRRHVAVVLVLNLSFGGVVNFVEPKSPSTSTVNHVATDSTLDASKANVACIEESALAVLDRINAPIAASVTHFPNVSIEPVIHARERLCIPSGTSSPLRASAGPFAAWLWLDNACERSTTIFGHSSGMGVQDGLGRYFVER